MPYYIVQSGRVGRMEDPGPALKVYNVGDIIELTADSARGFGAQLKPVDRAAAQALLDQTMPQAPPPVANVVTDVDLPQPASALKKAMRS